MVPFGQRCQGSFSKEAILEKTPGEGERRGHGEIYRNSFIGRRTASAKALRRQCSCTVLSLAIRAIWQKGNEHSKR